MPGRCSGTDWQCLARVGKAVDGWKTPNSGFPHDCKIRMRKMWLSYLNQEINKIKTKWYIVWKIESPEIVLIYNSLDGN